MSDGLVQFMHRKKENESGEHEQDSDSGQMLQSGQMKYMNFTKFQPGAGDVVIKKVKIKRYQMQHILSVFVLCASNFAK